MNRLGFYCLKDEVPHISPERENAISTRFPMSYLPEILKDFPILADAHSCCLPDSLRRSFGAGGQSR